MPTCNINTHLSLTLTYTHTQTPSPCPFYLRMLPKGAPSSPPGSLILACPAFPPSLFLWEQSMIYDPGHFTSTHSHSWQGGYRVISQSYYVPKSALTRHCTRHSHTDLRLRCTQMQQQCHNTGCFTCKVLSEDVQRLVIV